jgi:hypothetical protein
MSLLREISVVEEKLYEGYLGGKRRKRDNTYQSLCRWAANEYFDIT